MSRIGFLGQCISILRRHVAVDREFRHGEPESESKYYSYGGCAVISRATYELQGWTRGTDNLQEAARHPEEVDAGQHGYNAREANSCERDVTTTRDCGHDQTDEQGGTPSIAAGG
jgi:hypothetical protein